METPEPASSGSQPQRRSRSRKWLWWLVAIALGLIVLCGGACAGFVFLVFGAIRSSEPYQMALEHVQQDRQVIDRLGEPVEAASWFPSGSINVQNGGGTANLHFAVKGPKGKGNVSTQARRIGGKWGLTSVDVTFEDGERVLLDTSSASGLPEAPKWSPLEPDQGETESAPPVSPEPDLDTKIKVELPSIPKLPVE